MIDQSESVVERPHVRIAFVLGVIAAVLAFVGWCLTSWQATAMRDDIDSRFDASAPQIAQLASEALLELVPYASSSAALSLLAVALLVGKR